MLREALRCKRFDSRRGRDGEGDPDGDAPPAVVVVEDSDGERERRSRWVMDFRRGEENGDGSRFRWWLSWWSMLLLSLLSLLS